VQPLRILSQQLARLASAARCVFTPNDLKALFPQMSPGAFSALLARAASSGVLARVCRGLYVAPNVLPNDGRALFRFAARLRAHEFNYISLETVLSDAGVISQMPINTVFIMSSGRSSRISCGAWGAIEFVHTEQDPAEIASELHYDQECGLWRASVVQALRDMRATKRSTDLVNQELAHEFV
jgi:predicted transcriptional regulator of viral defense system